GPKRSPTIVESPRLERCPAIKRGDATVETGLDRSKVVALRHAALFGEDDIAAVEPRQCPQDLKSRRRQWDCVCVPALHARGADDPGGPGKINFRPPGLSEFGAALSK